MAKGRSVSKAHTPGSQTFTTYCFCCAEGIIVVKKAPKQLKHEVLDMPNLHVMMTMRSMTSKGFVKETYNWLYNYYVVTEEGLEHIRNYLQVPATVFPETFQAKRGPRPVRA